MIHVRKGTIEWDNIKSQLDDDNIVLIDSDQIYVEKYEISIYVSELLIHIHHNDESVDTYHYIIDRTRVNSNFVDAMKNSVNKDRWF